MPVVGDQQDGALGALGGAQQRFQWKDGCAAVVDAHLDAALELFVDGVHHHRDHALIASDGALHLVDQLVVAVVVNAIDEQLKGSIKWASTTPRAIPPLEPDAPRAPSAPYCGRGHGAVSG